MACLTDLLQLDEIVKFVAKLQQAGKVENLKQVYGVFGYSVTTLKIFFILIFLFLFNSMSTSLVKGSMDHSIPDF